MTTIDVSRELDDKDMAISRDDARRLEPSLSAALRPGERITLDTGGILRLGLGFVDETLLILTRCRTDADGSLEMEIRPPPSTPSFRKLAAHRGLELEADDAAWRLTAP